MAYRTLLANKNSCKGACKLQEPKDVINHWSASEWMKNDSFFHSHKKYKGFCNANWRHWKLLTCNVLKCILFYFIIRCTKEPNPFKCHSNQFTSIKWNIELKLVHHVVPLICNHFNNQNVNIMYSKFKTLIYHKSYHDI